MRLLHETAEFLFLKIWLSANMPWLPYENFAVCGGYPRDLRHGKTPKDLDLCVAAPASYGEEIADDLEAYLSEHEIGYKTFKNHSGISDNEDPYGDKHIYRVIKVGAIDVIFWDCKSISEVIKLFDYNINQFVLTVNNKYGYLGDLDTLGVLTKINDVSAAREQKVLAISEKLGWETPEPSQQCAELPF